MTLSNLIVNEPYPPIAIGGVGGSGTRLIAQLLKELGFYIGSDLNPASDNLWFTLLFKRIEILSISDKAFEELLMIFLKGMGLGENDFTEAQIRLIHRLAARARPQHHSATWLKQRARTLLATRDRAPRPKPGWGWKEPNTHIVIDRLLKFLPDLKYIHVARNGLDMAYSTNQSQPKLWGGHFMGADYQESPHYALKYWCTIHRRVFDLCRPMERRFYFLNYDQFCLDPRKGLKQFTEFLEMEASESQIRRLSNFVSIPASMGRFKHYGTHGFDPIDVSFVKELGFKTDFD